MILANAFDTPARDPLTSYEDTQDSLALLKMLTQSSKSIREGRSKPAKRAFAEVRRRVKERVV
jgi:hypothetical protein